MYMQVRTKYASGKKTNTSEATCFRKYFTEISAKMLKLLFQSRPVVTTHKKM